MRWPLPWPKSWRREAKSEPGATGPEGEPREALEEEETPKSLRRSALLFARDVAVAFLVVAIVMAALFAYTGVWPPMVVVESDSMQHAEGTSYMGVIDTGDLVLVQGVRQASDVVTYVEGRSPNRGHETYSAFGDVIIFHRPGTGAASTPIIHRAIVYVVPNASGGVDVPSLLDQGDWRGETASGPTTQPFGLQTLTIERVRSWRPGAGPGGELANVSYTGLAAVATDGFLTKGDHNSNPDSWGPVAVSSIVGRARGELPWFGLLKLALAPGETGCCPRGWGDPLAPKNSWDALLISLVLIIVGPFAADFGWSFWKGWRKKRAERQRTVPPSDAPPDGALLESPPSASGTAGDPPLDPEVKDEDQTGSAGPGAGGP